MESPGGVFAAWRNAWDGTLHVSVYLVLVATFFGACYIVYYVKPTAITTTTKNNNQSNNTTGSGSGSGSGIGSGIEPTEQIPSYSTNPRHVQPCKNRTIVIRGRTIPLDRLKQNIIQLLFKTPFGISLCIILFFIQSSSFASLQQVVRPGWLWNPFLILTRFRVVLPQELKPALKGVCLDYQFQEFRTDKTFSSNSNRNPLCLDEAAWSTLSVGALSSYNPEHVEVVLKGINYLQNESGGIIVSVMGRDVNEHIDSLRANVESLVPFISNLSVAIFENDSIDGSREHFLQWQQESDKEYTVDLIDCPIAVNCKFGHKERYDLVEDFWTSSTIGEMHLFRQRVLDYITSSPSYKDYSHILQLDLDIGVSISPLGILHSLGYVQDKSIVSSCRQSWPGGLGTLAPPYDFNAFESLPTKETLRLKSWHEVFCGIMPPNDRWQFVCQAATPMKFIQIISLDRANEYPYPVESAYNGAALYPLKLIRETNPKYEAGKYGQTCEHVSFHRAMKQPMFVNPKWDMHMSPTHPGGPKGEKAMRFMRHYGSLPAVAITMALQNVIPLAVLVLSAMTISIFFLCKFQAFWVEAQYPLFSMLQQAFWNKVLSVRPKRPVNLRGTIGALRHSGPPKNISADLKIV